MVEYENSGDTLVVEDERHEFPVDIGQVLQYDDMIVVVLSAADADYEGKHRNVICFDSSGDIKWRIEKQPQDHHWQVQYTSVFTKDGELWADSDSGWVFKIDPDNGTVMDRELWR